MEYLFPLIARREIAQETMEFTFDSSSADYQFKAGQHTDYTLIDPPQTDAEGNTRTFSFVNPPGTGKIVIASRMRDTAFKNSLKTVPLGTKVQVKEPMGRMILHSDPTKPAVFLVGGIGITPFMSIIADAISRHLDHQLFLFYSNRNRQTTAFFDQLEQWSKDWPSFHFLPTMTGPDPSWTGQTGRITEDLVRQSGVDLTQAVFYTAGPPELVKVMVELAEKLGATDERIKTEDFAGY